MAAGQNLSLKLRYRHKPATDVSKEDCNIQGLAMAPVAEEINQPDQPALEQQHERTATSMEHGIQSSFIMPLAPMIPLATSAASISVRRRRKSSTSLKRSASTPNVRGHHSSDAGMTLAEKRRNKLGYHRTSVACGHCRRRKIRCLLAPDDARNRCANCIRLKKECNFFPVDQQPQIERRPRHHSKSGTRGSTSSDSSPTLASGHLLEHVDPFNPYQPLPFSPQDFPPSSASLNGGLVSPLTRVPLDTRNLDFPQQHRTSWGSPFLDNGPTSAGLSSPGDTAHSYWGRHLDSPMTPGFSPHPSGPSSAIHSASDARSSFTSFAPSRSDSGWPMPTRSMSFGLVEDLPISYQNHYHHPQQPAPLSIDFRRRASEMHPPSLQTSANSSNTSISETHKTPLSAPLSSPSSHHWNLPSTWNTLPSNGGIPIKTPDYGGWYSDSTPLPKVQEEDIAPPFGCEPAILYARADYQ